MNSKSTKYIKGTLEREGMGEVAYFFKKAGQNIAYADYALDNTKFEKSLLKVKAIAAKLAEIRKLSSEVIVAIDEASASICNEIEEDNEDKE